jgi:hypothetical protein
MSAKLYKAATRNYWKTTLPDTISDVASIIGLVSTASLNPSQLQAPGILVLDRADVTGTNLTPVKREYISFGSISGPTIYDVTRGLAGSTAQGHTIGSLIEDVPSVTMWNDMFDWLAVEHSVTSGNAGQHDPFSHVRSFTMTGISGASGIKGDLVFVPGANVSIYAVSGASGYSRVLISAPTATPGGLPQLTVSGYLSTSTNVTPPMLVEENLSIRSISAVLKGPASGASLILDINKNGTSIFTDQTTRLSIAAGGTYASTASVAIKTLSPADILTLDIDNGTGDTMTCLIET